ncbi:THAP domaincontaining protein 5like [Caligus rogercresseyi]|uniref:THAP domaincontaining protein 5like n=1 Tax=Caligus rogercresseyi TaxID=217165 RepID=A0A7T8KAN6_CALRO|nr:THAP domaincontaining protein 5like [Caligus rogercresseyi]
MSDRLPKSVSTKATKVSLHIFLKDEELKKIWLRSIKRKDFCAADIFMSRVLYLSVKTRTIVDPKITASEAWSYSGHFPGGTLLSVIIHSTKNNAFATSQKR